MAEITVPPSSSPVQRGGNAFGRAWSRISPSLVPLLAVITALIITIPFMVLTGGSGDLSRGLNIAGTAYSALVEGSIGLAINDQVSRDNLNLVSALANTQPLSSSDLRVLARDITNVATVGADNARRFAGALAAFDDLDDETLEEYAAGIGEIEAVGVETLEAMRPLITELDALPRSQVNDLGEQFGALEALTPDDRTAIEAAAPSAAAYSDDDLLRYLGIVREVRIVALARLLAQVDDLEARGIALGSPEAADLAALADSAGGASAARASAGVIERLDAAAITDYNALSSQIAIVRELYSADLLTNDDVASALSTELDPALQTHLVVRRPGDRLIIADSAAPAGMTYTSPLLPANAEGAYLPEQRPDFGFLRLGASALLFFPANLEDMLVRATPFIIAGLAVALAFKAGMFNIGAEGQLYIGGIFAVTIAVFLPVWLGGDLTALLTSALTNIGITLSPDLARFIAGAFHLLLVLVAGMLGGALWGAIPGALKAFTGAHEVIVTIMLNYVAIRLVDWLIKSTEPLLLLDPSASTPRTAYIPFTAQLPRIGELSPWMVVAAAIVMLLVGLYSRRQLLAREPRAALRPVVLAAATLIVGLFLIWLSGRGSLHIGFVIMLLVVWLTDWFLSRTTLGFELRTVGANPDAARYAGMSVRRNIVLAMALSGLLAGIAGTLEISGVQFNMQPDFFSGLGFDAIAVALLARTNPRNMIAAGLLWGSLLAGAGLMQVRADISIDLVKIIQALIIMFIAADLIIRTLWGVPKTTEKTISTFSKGWGS